MRRPLITAADLRVADAWCRVLHDERIIERGNDPQDEARIEALEDEIDEVEGFLNDYGRI